MQPWKRQQIDISRNCFAVCNYALLLFQSLGFQPYMCREEYFVQTYLSICKDCVGRSFDPFTLWDDRIESFCAEQATTYFTVQTQTSVTTQVDYTTQTSNNTTQYTFYTTFSTAIRTSSYETTSSYPATIATIPSSFASATTTSSTSSTTGYSLSGLVTCPSRIINPTYTPTEPLPTTYLWGCQPGMVCNPPKRNCNYEQNLPADTYVCEPDQCILSPPLPDLNGGLARWNDPNYNLTAFKGGDGYFNLYPLAFGLDYDIYETATTSSVVTTSQNSTTSSASATNMTVTQSTSTSSSAAIPTNTPSSSHAWIAGAVLGPIIFLSLAALTGFFALRRRRRRNIPAIEQPTSTEKAQLPDTEVPRKELHGVHLQEVDAETARKELQGVGISELGPPMEPVELDAGSKSVGTGTETTLVSGDQRSSQA